MICWSYKACGNRAVWYRIVGKIWFIWQSRYC